jgi:putative FmdB family regulatory protein
MPIYEYECVDCGEVVEVFQKMSEPPIKKCPRCKGRVNRLISQCSFQLKGTGWYVTDYKSPSDAAKGNGGKRGETREEKKEEKKEEKPATTTSATKPEVTGGVSESRG